MKKALLIFLIGIITPYVHASNKLSIIVEAGSYSRENCIVSVGLSGLHLDVNSSVKLYEKTANKENAVSCQLIWEENKGPRLYWILDGKTEAGTTRTFIARKTRKTNSTILSMSVEDTGETLL